MKQNDAWLRWVSLAVPGIAAGLAWQATEGLPLLNRLASGIAVGLALYAIVHFAIKGFKR